MLFYAQSTPGLHLEDTLIIGDTTSEQKHKLIVDTTNIPQAQQITSKFIGAVTLNQTFTKTFRNFSGVDSISFSMSASPDKVKSSKAFLLRREHYIPPKRSWNQQGTLWVNGERYGTWFMPFGSLVEEYTFKHEDIMIRLTDEFPIDNNGHIMVNIKIQPESQWYDMAYNLYKVL